MADPQKPDPLRSDQTIATSPDTASRDLRADATVVGSVTPTDPATPPPAAKSGPRISKTFGRYEIEKCLGEGAMGAVYLAHDTQLGRDVALKIPKITAADGVEIMQRFFREARAAAMLRNNNICPVYDVGEVDGQAYITMAFIEGRDLKQLISSGKSISEKQVVSALRKLALALAEAHKLGIIHRDLKPANIMIDLKGEPVVMDFGLARRTDGEEVQVTQSGSIVGTPAYMSPEQVDGEVTLGPPTDIFSLGVIFYELLTLTQPFKGSLITILKQIGTLDPAPPSTLKPGLDPRLDKICLKMLSKSLEKRYASMDDVARDLTDFLRQPRPTTPVAEATPASPVPPVAPGDSAKSPAAKAKAPKAKATPVAPKPESDVGSETMAWAKLVEEGEPFRRRSRIRKKKPKAWENPLVLIGAGVGVIAVVVLTLTISSLFRAKPEPTLAEASGVNPKGRTASRPQTAKTQVPAVAAATSPGKALQFDGSSSYVQISTLSRGADTPATLEVWVRPEVQPRPNAIAVLGGAIRLQLAKTSSHFFAINGAAQLESDTENGFAPGVWVHLAAVADGREARFYVNGQKQGRMQVGASQPLPFPGLWLGAHPLESNPSQIVYNAKCQLDEIRVSSIARYTGNFVPAARFEPDAETLALYHCDEESGGDLKDETGRHPGKAVGVKWVTAERGLGPTTTPAATGPGQTAAAANAHDLKLAIQPELDRLTREIEANPRNASKFSARAEYQARLGRWKKAAADYQSSAKLIPQERYGWAKAATCFLMAGDAAAYREHCRAMAAQFKGTGDPLVADSVCKTCLLLLDTVPIADLPIQTIRNATPKTPPTLKKWFLGCCGLIAYRQGLFEEAVDWSKKNTEPTEEWGALALVVRAMAERQLGQRDEANKTLAQAEALIPMELRTLGTEGYTGLMPASAKNTQSDWLLAEILRREAVQLIRGGHDAK